MSGETAEERWNEGGRRNRGGQDEPFDMAQGGTATDDQTPPEEMDPQAVSPRQRLALEAFCKGGTIGDAAKAANVSRQTLHRWRAKYPHFALAMSSWSSACLSMAESQLAELASRAVGALSNAIDKGDARSAMAVLRSLGVLRTYQPSKAPKEEMRSAAVLPALNFGLEEPARGAGFQPVVNERQTEQRAVTPEQAGRLHNNENGKAPHNGTPAGETATPAAGDRRPPLDGHGGRRSCDAAMPGAAATIPVPAKTVPAAQHIGVTSHSPVERPKPAILPGKAGSAIKKACDSALQDVTECYQMLPNGAGQNASRRGVALASCG
jgi:transposase-like protein